MNQITKKPLSSLGYGFIPERFIPKGRDEYYLRDIQHRPTVKFKKLTPKQVKVLEAAGNISGDWNNVLVTANFDAALVKNCAFYGLVRIGKLEPSFAEFNNLRVPVGLYNSTIISSDLGDNVSINNVNFLSHYIIGNDVILVNINELATTDHSKFGNGVLKEGEKESVRVWIEVCNENAGRKILAFNGMTTSDAWLWSKYREDENLLNKFREFTDKQFDTARGYYGKIGDRTVIKNSRIIKDVWIGSDAYIKGANKLKNLTINSSPEAQSQIGEGCELVNGIIGFGCRVFYGVKAVRFMMGTNSQLKYGARLINSFLGDNSTISCCEVLNSLIFPAHEQHHNNSFLCAATVLGQSNMAAGATIGSNHNSRAADGEILAGRGFWPGLCVSLKHNSKFASFTLIAKGDFPAELNITLPFSLISNDVGNDQLTVMPGYWFLYNMYALSRNSGKYTSRDKRIDKTQKIEYGFLAPDSVNEMINALDLLKLYTGKAISARLKNEIHEDEWMSMGEDLLENKPGEVADLRILADGIENGNRPVILLKVAEAYAVFKELIIYYGTCNLLEHAEKKKIVTWAAFNNSLPEIPHRTNWSNIGGQLMPDIAVQKLIDNIHSGKTANWDEVHKFYSSQSKRYATDKFEHSFAAMLEILGIPRKKFTKQLFISLLKESAATKNWMTESIHSTREKDYENPYRQMLYDTREEMESVVGKLIDNTFIRETKVENELFRNRVLQLIHKLR